MPPEAESAAHLGCGHRKPGVLAQAAEPTHLPVAHSARQQEGQPGGLTFETGLTWSGLWVVAPEATPGQMWALLVIWNCRKSQPYIVLLPGPSRSQPHTGAQLTRLLPCAGWILVFSLRAFGSLCSWAVHIQAATQLSCEHAAP